MKIWKMGQVCGVFKIQNMDLWCMHYIEYAKYKYVVYALKEYGE